MYFIEFSGGYTCENLKGDQSLEAYNYYSWLLIFMILTFMKFFYCSDWTRTVYFYDKKHRF